MDNSSSSRLTSSPGDAAACYDVFLSFRGEDTRDSFTDHLYEALGRAGLLTFRDNDEIDRGRELKPEINRAIKASKASIVVLSKHYATSTWCLEELWLILEQRRDFNHFVLPVFYRVDPSDVRKQDKTFKIQVKTSSKWTSDNVKQWKAALTKVADLTGFVLSGPETKLLKEIVDTVYNELDCKRVHLPPDLIGMDTRYEKITSWLHEPNLEFLAICGMGGSGKTTLAKYIYNLNWKRFENMSFLEDIGTSCKGAHGFLELQEQLLKDISGGRKRKIPSVSHGTYKIEEALQTKKTLIVLDGIVEYSELVALLGTGKINPLSKIIITTENTDNWFKFSSHKCEQYIMELLNDDESLELLSRRAFGAKIPAEGFREIAAQAAKRCEGNPLGLGVLGSSLSNSNTILEWRSRLNLLEKDIHSEIQGVLMRSYVSLPFDFERELFLHIACFFIGKDMDYVVKILEPDYSAASGIKTLINRCLLSVSSSNKLMMHRLLQETGRNIVRKESFRLPEKRSRVWLNNDSYKILRNGKGSKTIEGLTLDMDKLKEEGAVSRASNLKTDALEKMEKLKLLQLNFVELTGSHENFSEDLRWLCWFEFHLRTIPSGLFMGNLVALDMSYSKLEVFEPPMVLQSLQILNLKDSHNLLEIRNISMVPRLETLVLWNCHSLVHVCETIRELTSLALLNMTGCKLLCTREKINQSEAIEASTSGGQVTKQPPFFFPYSLQRLFLNECNLECTASFPLSFNVQPFLQYLNISKGLFEFLPYYAHLKSLRVLDLSFCKRLKWLLCLPSTLAELYVYYCESLEKITFQSHRFTLQEFGYVGCINLSEIEDFLKLVPIAKLDETDLGHLKWLKKYQSHEVLLVGDDQLTKGRSPNLQMLYEFDITSTSLPNIKDSKTTPEYISESSSLSFDVPSCPKNRRLKGLNVTFKYTISGDDWVWFAKISTATGIDLMYNPKVFGRPGSGEVGIWLGYWPIGNALDVGDKVNVSIDVMSGLEVHECGASLVYTDDEIAEETVENNMGGENFLGGGLSGFQLITGAYYLCRRDFVELMEIGKLTPDWFGVLAGDTIDNTEVRGWRMTGRPKQLNPSFTELKTVRCIIHGPQLEEIYKIAEMSESSSVNETVEFTSSILRETTKSWTTSETSDAATKEKNEGNSLETINMFKAFVSDEIKESAQSPSPPALRHHKWEIKNLQFQSDPIPPSSAKCEWDFRLSAVVSSSAADRPISDILAVVEVNPSGTLFATGGTARKIRLYDLNFLLSIPPSAAEHPLSVDHAAACHSCICTPAKLSSLKWKPWSGGRVMGSADFEGVVTEYDLETKMPVFERDEHDGRRIWSMDYSHRDPVVGASGSDDGTMQMWDPRYDDGGHHVATVRFGSPVCCVEFSPFGGGTLLAVGCADTNAYVYDVRKMDKAVAVFNGHERTVSYTRFVDDRTVVTSGTDGCLRMWDVEDQTLIRTYRGHTNHERFVGLSIWRNQGLIGCGSESNEVFVYDKRWGEPIWVHGFEPERGTGTRSGEYGFVSGLCWSQQGEDECTLVVGGSDGVAKIFSVKETR